MASAEEVDMSALISFYLRKKFECSIAEKKKEFNERANDFFMGRFSCIKSKNSTWTFVALLYIVPESLLGVAFISERKIVKLASK